MKTFLVFLGLKIAEIAAIVFVPWGIGALAKKWGWLMEYVLPEDAPCWVVGIFILAMSSSIFFFIQANWDWAKSIVRK